MAKYRDPENIGSVHWFRTLLSQLKHIGECLGNEERKTDSNPNLVMQYGAIVYNISQDLIEWQETGKPLFYRNSETEEPNTVIELTIKKAKIVGKWVEFWFEEDFPSVSGEPNAYQLSSKSYKLWAAAEKASFVHAVTHEDFVGRKLKWTRIGSNWEIDSFVLDGPDVSFRDEDIKGVWGGEHVPNPSKIQFNPVDSSRRILTPDFTDGDAAYLRDRNKYYKDLADNHTFLLYESGKAF